MEHILRRRHVVADHIHELDDADVERAGAGDDREERAGADGLAQYAEKLLKRELFAVEVAHHKLVVGFDGALDKRLAGRGHGVGHIGGHVALGEVLATVALIHIGFSGEDVDEALEILLLAYRQVERHGLVRDVFLYICHDVVKVGMFSVKFADEENGRSLKRLGKLPHVVGLHFDSGGRVHEDERAVRNAHRAALFSDEVGEARRIQNIKRFVFIRNRRERGADGNTAFLFFRVEVGNRVLVLDLAHAADEPGVEQESLVQSGLPGTSM